MRGKKRESNNYRAQSSITKGLTDRRRQVLEILRDNGQYMDVHPKIRVK